MNKKEQKGQIILILIGFLLIIATYFYYPYMNKTKLIKNKSDQKKIEKDYEDSSTTFENVEYKGLYDLDKSFTVKSNKAHTLNKEPDIIYMNDMHVILYLSDGRIVNITSKEGKYNKSTYDCYFEKNVVANDGETHITAENLDLLATTNIVKIYNNVNLNYPTGSLRADKIDYDFETKFFEVSMMSSDEMIKMKIIN